MNVIDQDGAGFLIADVLRLIRRSFRLRLRGTGMTLAQARTLIYVARNEGIRQVEIAELLEVQPITLARLIDHLSERGLVERRPDPTDRRAHQLFLTPAAAPHLVEINRVIATIRADSLQGLAEDEAELALSALRKMRANLSPQAPRQPTAAEVASR